MRIYFNSNLVSVYKRLILKEQGGLLAKLIGINFELDAKDEVHVYPVYRHFILFKRYPGQLLIEISLGLEKSLIISISSRGIETRIMKTAVSDIGKEII